MRPARARPGARTAGRVFATPQLKVLEKVFAENAFPDLRTCEKLALKLGVTARQVKVWFSNKRQRVRDLSAPGSDEDPQTRGRPCHACKVAHVNCDRGSPSCKRCARLGIACVQPPQLSRGRPPKPGARPPQPHLLPLVGFGESLADAVVGPASHANANAAASSPLSPSSKPNSLGLYTHANMECNYLGLPLYPGAPPPQPCKAM